MEERKKKQTVNTEEALNGSVSRIKQQRIAVVRAKQERTGILYSDMRKLQTPEDAVAAFGSLFENAGVEHLLAVALTQSGEPVALQVIGIRAVNSCQVAVAEIMKFALLSNCPGVLLLHNHPSGNVLPSKEDEKTTLRVKDAGSLLGIDLVDHVIVGEPGTGYSIEGKRFIQAEKRQDDREGQNPIIRKKGA